MIEPDRWGLYPADWDKIRHVAPIDGRYTFVGRLMQALALMRQEMEADTRRLEECKNGK